MSHVFRWAVAAVSVIILTVVLASNAKADSVELELKPLPPVRLSHANGYRESSTIIQKCEGQYGCQLSLKLHELKLNDTGYQINLATEQNQFDNVWGYLESNSNHLKSEDKDKDGVIVISSEVGRPTVVTYEARLKDGLPAGNYSGEVQYTITAKPAPEPVVKEINSKEYRDNDDVKISIKGKNLSSIKSVELFDQSDKNKPVAIGKKEDNKSDSSDGASMTFDFGKLSAGRYFATVYSVSDKSYKVLEPLVVWPRGDCVSGNSEFNKCKVVLPQSNDTKFIPVVPSGEGTWTVVADGTGDDSQFGVWYDYGKKHWANVLEVPNDKYNEFNKAGKQIKDGEYKYHWIYLPRYAYEVRRRDAKDKPSFGSYKIKFEPSNAAIKYPQRCEGVGRDYRTECGVSRQYENQSSTWATHPAFSEGEAGVWITSDEYLCNNHYTGWDRYAYCINNMIKNHGYTAGVRVGNNREWGALAYLTLSSNGANTYDTKCSTSTESGDCWGFRYNEQEYFVGAGVNSSHSLAGVDYYDVGNFTNDKVMLSRCTFETCGGQAMHEVWIEQHWSGRMNWMFNFSNRAPYWLMRKCVKTILDIDSSSDFDSGVGWAFVVLPVKADGTVIVEKKLMSSLAATPQRLQPQLKAAQPNRISEQASSVKLETSQQVSGAEATKTSERPTARPLDQQLSPAVRNRTEGTTDHAAADDAIPQVKRQRQAVTTGPVLRPNSTDGQTSLATGQSPVAGVLGAEQNFVKQGLTHASSLMTAE